MVWRKTLLAFNVRLDTWKAISVLKGNERSYLSPAKCARKKLSTQRLQLSASEVLR
jgi:hypothetical protein